MENYLIDYHYNGRAKYFDFYLFVNPLGRKCYCSEQEINKAKQLVSSKIDINILCIHNEHILNDFMNRLGIKQASLELRNRLYCQLYQAALAVKAAQFQGKRKGRHFLRDLQMMMNNASFVLTDNHLAAIADQNGLDLDLFFDDYRSDFVRDLYFKDLKIANSMGVTLTPSLVIFDSLCDQSGILLEGPITCETILHHLDSLMQSLYQEEEEEYNISCPISLIQK